MKSIPITANTGHEGSPKSALLSQLQSKIDRMGREDRCILRGHIKGTASAVFVI